MKKILFLTNHLQFSDGVANVLVGLCNNLDTDKYDITVRSLFKFDKEFIKQFDKNIKVESVFHFYFRGFSRIIERIPAKLLYKVAVKENYDLEIGFQYGLPTKIIANSFNNKAKHVVWMHTYDYDLVLRDCYQKADEVVCVSKENSERLLRELNGNVNVTYCYNLVDDRKIKKMADETMSLAPRYSPLVVSVGRHSKEKGYVRLVKILSELHEEGFKFECWLVGDGPEHNLIVEEIKERNASDYIVLIGADSNPHKYTSKADIFICSSFSEGYSTACTEAAILNVPVITTAVGGAKEIIETAESGLIVEQDDASLKNAIKSILSNPDVLDEWKKTIRVAGRRFELDARRKEARTLIDGYFK